MSDIQSVKRAFAILKTIAAHSNSVSPGKIARQVDLPKSTVSRMLSTLESIKAVERVPHSEGFRIGPTTIALVLQPPHVVATARPFLLELARATGESINLCLLDGEQVHYADQVESRHNVQIRDWTGTRMSFLHAISPGKVFLAHWPDEQIEAYLTRPLERFTRNTITEPHSLRQQLQEIREQGYAWAYEEFEKELVGLSAPAKNRVGQVVAVVNVSWPAFRFPPPDQAEEIARLTVETARQISRQLQGKF